VGSQLESGHSVADCTVELHRAADVHLWRLIAAGAQRPGCRQPVTSFRFPLRQSPGCGV